ncbi:PolC-type DNA polymerase III [Streptomyces sp. NPDC058268]|uniref:3'-5' exonuclease n=1 Tax=Streptomyces sp. NPDC058268 TaxID=3346413 RepID=UPI0036F052B1
MGRLTEDPDFRATTFVIIDFETTTPTGYPAQPIEVAALALRYGQGGWTRIGSSTSLIKPPAFAPVTSADTALKRMTPEMFTDAPTPAEALGELDRNFTPGSQFLLVAQNASVEANIIHNQREHCPDLAHIDFLDTIPFAKRIVPGLPFYGLDNLLAYFSIAQPADRHRAQADVEVTAMVFRRLVRAADELPQFSDLAALVKVAGRTAKSNMPVQDQLF